MLNKRVADRQLLLTRQTQVPWLGLFLAVGLEQAAGLVDRDGGHWSHQDCSSEQDASLPTTP